MSISAAIYSHLLPPVRDITQASTRFKGLLKANLLCSLRCFHCFTRRKHRYSSFEFPMRDSEKKVEELEKNSETRVLKKKTAFFAPHGEKMQTGRQPKRNYCCLNFCLRFHSTAPPREENCYEAVDAASSEVVVLSALFSSLRLSSSVYYYYVCNTARLYRWW